MGHWCFNVAGEKFESFRNYLASPPEGSGDLAFRNEHNQRIHGWLFCRPETAGKNRHRLNIRRSRLLHPDPDEKKSFGRPLCSGFVRFAPPLNKAFPLYGGWRQAALSLSLNLQRFMRHQPQGQIPSGELQGGPPRITTRKDDRSKFEGERAYDGEDNWIPNTPEWSHFASSKASLMHLGNYLEKVAGLFEREMRRAASLATESGKAGVSRHREHLSLSVVETVWEFASESPLNEVLEIANRLMHLRKNMSLNRYSMPSSSKLIGLGRVERNLESPAFRIPLADNVEVRLYAKTNRRIRFEVVQRGLWKQWSELLREAGGMPGGKDTPRTVEEFLKVIVALRKRAASHLNKLMQELQASKAEGLLCRPVVDLLAEIAAAMPSSLDVQDRASLTREVLHLLCYQKGFRRTIANSELSPPFTTLKKRGVVRWDKRRRFYVLSPEFAPAADALEKLTGNPFTAFFGRSKDLRSFYRVGKRLFRDR